MYFLISSNMFPGFFFRGQMNDASFFFFVICDLMQFIENHFFKEFFFSLFVKVKQLLVFLGFFKIITLRFDNFSLHFQLQVYNLKIGSICFMVLRNI